MAGSTIMERPLNMGMVSMASRLKRPVTRSLGLISAMSEFLSGGVSPPCPGCDDVYSACQRLRAIAKFLLWMHTNKFLFRQ
jgi:hypothetical protein